MSPAGFSIRNSVLVNILMITIIVIGTVSFIMLPRELVSEVSLNMAFIIALYPGASPKEVEQLVTIPIEDEIKDVDGIDFILSQSGEGFSFFNVKFEDMSKDDYQYAFQDLKSRVENVTDLPSEVEDIDVEDVNTADFIPIINITISGSIPEKNLREIADSLEDRVRNIQYVSRIEKMGMRDREIWVEVDPQRMFNFGLTLPQIISTVASKNLNMPGGTLKSGRSEFLIRTVGEIEKVEELKNVILRKTPGGHQTLISDLAEVTETYQSETGTISRLEGLKSITLSISKKSKGNSFKIIDEIKEIVSQYAKSLNAEVYLGGDDDTSGAGRDARLRLTVSDMAGSGSGMTDRFLKFTVTGDTSVQIRSVLETLEYNAMFGLTLVVLLLYVFLGLRYAFMAALGMVIAFLGTFIFMRYIGESFNGNSLFGLVLVMGIVVDDSIIILENCYRYLQAGLTPREAALKGTDEVIPPVMSATLTTISAFLPLMLLPGVVGKFMRIIPMVVSMALAAALVEAFIILPSHIADWSGRKVPDKKNRVLKRINHYYPLILRNIVHFRYLFVILGLFSCIASAFLIPLLGVNLFAGEEMSQFRVFVEMPIGTSLEVTDETMKRFEAEAMKLPSEDLEAVITTTGLMQTSDDWIFKSYVGQVILDLKEREDRKRDTDELIEILRNKVEHISGPKNVQFWKVVSGPPTGKPVEIKVKGKYLEQIREITHLVEAELRRIPGVYDIGNDFYPGKQEIKIRVDEEKAALFGINVAQVAATIQAAYLGTEASVWRDGDEEVKIKVKLAEKWRKHPEDLLRLKIGNMQGVLVPLAKIAVVETEQGFSEIRRFKGERAITVRAEVEKEKASVISINNTIREKFRDLSTRYPGYTLDFQGEFKEFREVFNNILQLFLIGVFLIYLILAGQFRSFTQPFIIMFTVPFAFLGAMVGLIIHGEQFTVITMYGIVALTGIAVNDAIVMITFINNARKRGESKYNSVIEAGMLRLRPIILTTVTTIGGLLPMAIGMGGHSDVWEPLARTIVWGMGFATILTLLIIPAVYTIIEDDISTPMRRLIRRIFNLAEKEENIEIPDDMP